MHQLESLMARTVLLQPIRHPRTAIDPTMDFAPYFFSAASFAFFASFRACLSFFTVSPDENVSLS